MHRWEQAPRFHEMKREVLTFRPDGSLTLRTDRSFFMGRNATCITTETGHFVVVASKRPLKNALYIRCAIDAVSETRSSLSGPGTKTSKAVLTKPQVRTHRYTDSRQVVAD